MKCNNCGAEVKGKVCEYCGCEMPEEKTPVNITNNYYGTTPESASDSTNNSVGCKCPKCGGSRVSFRREKTGTSAERHGKNYKSQSSYRTVGICQSCGYAWNPNGQKGSDNSKIWLWVLGWIFIFPVPLTILLLKKKDMKPVVKYGIIVLAWVIFLALGISANNKEEVPNNGSYYVETEQAEQYVILGGIESDISEKVYFNKGTEDEVIKIMYNVPAGTYTVTNASEKYSDCVYVYNKKIVVNDAGFEEFADSHTSGVLEPGEKTQITISEDESVYVNGPANDSHAIILEKMS